MHDIFDRVVLTGTVRPIPERYLGQGIDAARPFPQSYVAFVRRFGYGLTCGLFRIHVPLGDFPDSFYMLSPGIIRALEAVLRPSDPQYDFLYQPDGSRELIPHLVGFATGENGESLFWDTRSPGEYPIYLTSSGTGIRYGGSSIDDFITRVTNAGTVEKVMPFARKALPLTFECSTSRHIDPWL